MRKAAIGIIMTGMAVCLCFTKTDASAAPLQALNSGNTAHQRHIVRGWNWSSSDKDKKYTQAEYEFAVSLKFDGYESMKVGDYNKKVLDWEDETAFHETEDILNKVYYGLKEDDPEYEFFMTTLSNTWEECSVLHYNACHKEKPSYSGEAARETFGDIYGDKVLLTGAYADFSFDYEPDSMAEMTVAQRDQALESIQTEMQAILDQFDQSELKDEDKMEKVLEEKLAQVLEADENKISADTKPYLYYYWEDPYQYEFDDSDDDDDDNAFEGASDGEDDDDDALSDEALKEKYDIVLNALHYSDYESMTIGEFNRLVNGALNGEKTSEEFINAYEAVMWAVEYKGTGQEREFLTDIVQTSLNEYNAKVKEVYSGKNVDPEIRDYIQIEHKSDVFGDKVTTGVIYTDYTFTYRILDSDTLTVGEREQFLASVKESVKAELEKEESQGKITEDDFKAILESAGASVSTDKIQLTGYKVEYFESEVMD